MALKYTPALANLAVYGELGKESEAQEDFERARELGACTPFEDC